MSFSPIGFAPFLLFLARSCYGCMIPVSAASCRSLFWIFLPNGNEFRFVSEPLCIYDNSLCDVCQRFCFFCPGGISVPPASIGNLKNCRFFMITTKHLQATFFSQSISANWKSPPHTLRQAFLSPYFYLSFLSIHPQSLYMKNPQISNSAMSTHMEIGDV